MWTGKADTFISAAFSCDCAKELLHGIKQHAWSVNESKQNVVSLISGSHAAFPLCIHFVLHTKNT
jgi:hypothetical protein